QWCCSANAMSVATEPRSMYSTTFSSQSSLSLSMPYLSAATSRCCLRLRQRVGVDEGEEGPEHLRLHVVNLHDGVAAAALLHLAEELRLEHRRPGRENAPVRRERLAGDRRRRRTGWRTDRS
ncbi:hypothetical protein EE612_051543, partial [Oryza sativa]